MTDTESRLDELRAILTEIERLERKSRTAIAREAKFDAPKMSKLLPKKNRRKKPEGSAYTDKEPQGVDAETAIRLWEYAQLWKNDHAAWTIKYSSPETGPAKASDGADPLPMDTNVTVDHEDNLRLPDGVEAVVKWLRSASSSTECLGVITAAGDRMILPCSGSFGRKIGEFRQSLQQSPITAEEIVKNTERVRLKRYLDAAWAITVGHSGSNAYDLTVTNPRHVIRAGSELVVLAESPEGLVLVDLEKPESKREMELRALAKEFTDILDSCTSVSHN